MTTLTREQLSALEGLGTMLQGMMQKEKATGFPSGTPALPYNFGPGGLFSTPGISRDVISTRIQPKGVASMLPARPSMDMNPLYAYISGFLAPTGSNPNGVCDDGPTAGPIKGCLQTAQYGRYTYQTRELEINRLGQRTNRGEFFDLRILNSPLYEDQGGNGITSPAVPGGNNPALTNEVMQRFVELGVAFQNKLSVQVFQGNPANNTGGGGYQEFPGLDILIGTNKKDAISGVSCPSLASQITNLNYANISTATTSSNDIVNILTYQMRMLNWIADRTNMNPVSWAFVMRPSLWWELSALWPCSYLTARCQFRTNDGSIVQTVNANDQIAMRDAMRQGMYLLIDGKQYPVVLDDGIFEDTNTTSSRVTSGNFASDIYIIPMTVTGGMAATYWEFLDFTQGAMVGARDGNLSPGYFWTDDGKYLWHAKPPVNWCVQWIAKTEPRIILLTPHLAARVQHIQYAPLMHEREPFPTSPYFVDGGVSTGRPAPSFFSDWKL